MRKFPEEMVILQSESDMSEILIQTVKQGVTKITGRFATLQGIAPNKTQGQNYKQNQAISKKFSCIDAH